MKRGDRQQDGDKGQGEESLSQRFLKLQSRDKERDFKTPAELAGELNLTASRIRQLVDEGKLAAIRVGGRILIYRPAAIRQLITDY